MKIVERFHRRRDSGARGSAIVEYVVVTSMALGALLLPLGNDHRNVVERLIDAIQREHAGFLYAASVPSLPRGETPADSVPPAGTDESGGNGGSSGDPAPSDTAGSGSGTPPPEGVPQGPHSAGGPTASAPSAPGGGGHDGSDDGASPDVAAGDVTDPDHPVDDGADDDVAHGDASCPAPGIDAMDAGDDVFASASQRTALLSTHVGNPIHVVTGNKYQREVDLHLPELRLSFVRHYNSRSTRNRGLGVGWTHGFDVRLVDRGDRASLWQADGRRIDFRRGDEQDGVRHFQAKQHSDGRLIAERGGYTWHWRDGTSLAFDRDRKLRQIRDTRGHVLRLIRDARGRLRLLKTGNGDALEIRYDGRGRVESLVAPGGTSARYAYDDHGNPIRAEDTHRGVRRYHYDDPHDPHNLTGISAGADAERLTRIKTWTYDDQDRGIGYEPTDPAGRIQLAYEAGRTRVVDAGDRTGDYLTGTLEGVPVVHAVHGVDCSRCAGDHAQRDVRYTYNTRLQLLTVDAAKGIRRTFEYDARGRLVRVVDAARDGDTVTQMRIGYRSDSDQVETVAIPSVNPRGEHAISLRYREDGQIEQRIETGFAPQPDGGYAAIRRSQRFGYERNRLATVSGFRQDLTSRTRMLGDGSGAMSDMAFRDGGALRVLQWDRRGRPVRMQADDQPPLTFDYGADGRIASAHSDRGTAILEYEATGELKSIRNPDRPQIALRLDQEDFAAFQTRHPVNTGAAVSPATLAAFQPFAATGLDRRGRQISATDRRGLSTQYAIDDFGRRVFTLSPDNGLTRYEYDEENNLRRSTDASGADVRFGYDAGNRLVETHWPDGAARFEWATGGGSSRLARIDTDDSADEAEYDQAGRLARRVQVIGTQRYVTEYRHDDRGQLHTKRLPDGRILEYRRASTPAGDREQIDILESRWLRDIPLITGLRNERSRSGGLDWTTASGIQTTRRQERGRLWRLRIGPLHDFAYRYDRVGRIVGIDDRQGPVARYRFDADGRLDLALTPSTLYGYRYDANGNRVREVDNGHHTTYAYSGDTNRLIHVTTATRRWSVPMTLGIQALMDGDRAPALHTAVPSAATDRAGQLLATYRPSGEMETLGALGFTYDANGQIESVWRGERRIARYQYDAYARRIAKQTFHAPSNLHDERHYLYEHGRLSGEADASGRILVQYLYVGGHLAALLTPRATYFVHTDHLGAPIAVTDAGRRTVWSARYAPFGRATIDEDPDRDRTRLTLNLRLPGQYEDAETGLHYNHHRYYDPDLGRYLSPDPLGLAAGPNPYLYAGNDPVNFIDPSGLLLFAFDGTGNNSPPPSRRDISNVVKFREAYLGDPGEMAVRAVDGSESEEHHFYISGAATTDARTGITGTPYHDGLTGSSILDRVAALASDFFDHMAWLYANNQRNLQLNIDTIGFSRGAAQARIFVNLLTAFLNGEDHFVLDRTSGRRSDFSSGDPAFVREYMRGSCVGVNLRFLGLFDTVPHYGTTQDDDLRQLDLEIDAADDSNAVDYVAHAVAANENRRDFHAISIHAHPLKGNTEARMELGFIGAHSDIGGGYSEGDLSDVALMWMVKRASEVAGVSIDISTNGVIRNKRWNQVTTPVLHDSADAWLIYREGRFLKYTNGIDQIAQRLWYDSFPDPSQYGMDYKLSTSGYIGEEYRSGPPPTRGTTDLEGNSTLFGLVKGLEYGKWLQENYGLDIVINETGLNDNRRPPPARQ